MAGQKFLIKARSSCKGGRGGHCSHVFVLLFQLNDYSCFNIRDIPSDAIFTRLPQSWYISRAVSLF